MKKKIPAADRHRADEGWLKAYRLFSFADYEDKENMEFGNLRAFNDDTIEPRCGFPHHAHNNMEIVTMVFQGELTHEDDLGNKRVICSGECQKMSAGDGVIHSEFNFGDEPVSLYQIWFEPDSSTPPAYQEIKLASKINDYQQIAAKNAEAGVLSINASAKVDYLVSDSTFEDDYIVGGDKGLFLYVKKGKFEADGESLSEGDQLRISSVESVNLKSIDNGEMVLVTVTL